MKITIYGKAKCKFCDLTKRTLKRQEIPFLYVDLLLNENWRNDDNTGAAAFYHFENNELLPVIKIDNNFYNQKDAIKFIREARK